MEKESSGLKVYIGIPTAEHGRYSMFHDFVNMLVKPEGTIGRSFHTDSGARNRNLIIDDALSFDATHILFIDDDMAFSPNSLIKLLEDDLDVVSGLYYNRAHPHSPLLFDVSNPRRSMFIPKVSRRLMRDEDKGIIEVDACGFGFLLAKTHIFKDVEKPYVRIGEMVQDARNEDIGFCNRVRAAGYKIHCDLDVLCGHMAMATIWPTNIDGKWHTSIDTGGDEVFTVPQQSAIKIKTQLDLVSK